ncbi:MAG: carboxypeptidase regulatory-like domain-containing protein [Acidobacteria bacterium]|nr:carboxypeptidase regulatory-like domain-containing protein [Acidobacteriota bacterium]
MRTCVALQAHRPLRSLLAAVLLCSLAACRQGVPIIDTAPRPTQADGTISGTVRGPEGTSAIDGRAVEVVNVDTGERQKVTTNNAGGFTFKVRPGKYRVEVVVLQGEVVLKRPGIISVNRSDVDAHADFILGSSRVLKQRWPRLRGDDGLGSPIA